MTEYFTEALELAKASSYLINRAVWEKKKEQTDIPVKGDRRVETLSKMKEEKKASLGETESGKSIYYHSNANHKDYHNFDKHDHKQAADAHYNEAKKTYKKMKGHQGNYKKYNENLVEHHIKAYNSHMDKYRNYDSYKE